MYKVMVVDDETWGRKSISKMIAELGLGVEVIAEARHGQEALELIRISKPHIVVTDMNMPVMNGEQFLESLYKQHSEIRIIVISGYSQFEYMKAALTYQACEYVLKPISVPDLKNAMLKAIEASRNYLSLQQQKKFSQDILKLRREEFLQHVTGRRITNASDIQHQSEELHIPRPAGGYHLAVCMFRQFQEIARTKFHGNADLLMYSIENIFLYEVLKDDIPLVYKSDDKTSLCLLLSEPVYDEQRIIDLAAMFQTAVNAVLKTDVVIGLSPLFLTLDKLPEACGSATDQLRANRLNGSGLSFSSANRPGSHGSAGILTSFDMKALRQAFGSCSEKDCRKLLVDFIHRVEKRPATTIRDVQREAAKVIELASSEMKGLAASAPSLFDPRTLAGILDLKQLQTFVEQLLDAAHVQCANGGKSESAHSIGPIVEFLDSRYFEDISLIDVATRFHMDPSYLSKLFKSVTDENFIEYVTRKRMEKACELLSSTDLKISEIAELVGYENQRYFSQVFKKFTDQTPSEYREHHKILNID